jgi:catechol 2,3-dioxygenase
MTSSPWPLRDVTLKVLDLPWQTAFYQEFGFRLLEHSAGSARLSAGDGFFLTLRHLPNGEPRPERTAGLYHFAILLPDRAALGSFLRHASGHRWNFVGAADHLVSEALYFSDPEENGIEVYADRPRGSWEWSGGHITMATLPLDLRELSRSAGPQWNTFPKATRLGHMHLTVRDLDASQSFYELLGLRLTANWGHFRFLSWDGYHHHIALNLLAGHRPAPVTPGISGLDSFSICRDSVTSLLADPNGIALLPSSASA